MLEVLRYILIFIGVFVAECYQSPQEQLAVITLFFIVSLAGLTGIEGYFLGKYASAIVGYQDPGPYQKQSAINNLALTIATIITYVLDWGLHAQLALISVLMLFLFLSGTNHALDAIKNGNRSLRNYLRPIGSTLIIITVLYYMLPLIKG